MKEKPRPTLRKTKRKKERKKERKQTHHNATFNKTTKEGQEQKAVYFWREGDRLKKPLTTLNS